MPKMGTVLTLYQLILSKSGTHIGVEPHRATGVKPATPKHFRGLVMRNWSIGTKMAAALGVVAAVILGFSLFALLQIAQVNDKARDVARVWLPAVRQVSALQLSLAELRLYHWRHFTAADPAALADAERQITEERARLDGVRARYAQMLHTAEDRADLNRFNTAFAALDRHNNHWLTLSRAGRQAEAMAYFKGPTRQAYDATREALGVIVARNAAGAQAASDAGAAIYRLSIAMTLGAIAAVLALAVAAGLYLRGAIARPVRAMTEAMSTLAGGDLDVAVPARDRGDEIGQLAGAMESFKQAAIDQRDRAAETLAVVEQLGLALAAMARGDLTYRLDARVSGAFAQLREDFNRAAEALCETLAAISARVETTRVAASDIEMASGDLAARTSRQAAGLEETATAVTALTQDARHAADQVRAVAEGASKATHAAEQGLAVAVESVAAMRAIAESSNRIGDIASLIDAIAFQTNLLALNAGVEAARAGDAGRGFAVVATEVRALAQRSAEAAKEVKAMITAASAQVESGVALVQRSGEALNLIVAETTQVGTLAATIRDVVERQSGSIGEISAAVAEMNSGTQQNAAMVEETNATCVSLAREAVALEQAVRHFETGAGTPPPAPRRLPAAPVRGNLALVPAAEDWAAF